MSSLLANSGFTSGVSVTSQVTGRPKPLQAWTMIAPSSFAGWPYSALQVVIVASDGGGQRATVLVGNDQDETHAGVQLVGCPDGEVDPELA